MYETYVKFPCRDCQNKRVEDNYNCHDFCEKYKEAKAKNEKAKQVRNAGYNQIITEYRAKRITQARRKQQQSKKR